MMVDDNYNIGDGAGAGAVVNPTCGASLEKVGHTKQKQFQRQTYIIDPAPYTQN